MIGYLIAKYPVICLIVTFSLLAPLLSFFLIYPVDIETDVRRGFAHRNGRSSHEFEVFGRFYNVSMEDMELLVVLIESKDEGLSGLPISAKLLNEVERLDTFISKQWASTADGKNLTFREMQSTRGSINFLFHAFKFGFDWQQSLMETNSSLEESIHIDYPVSKIFGHNVTLGSHFFGVERYDKMPVDQFFQIKSTRSIVLWYMLGANGQEQRKYLRNIELKIFETSRQNFSDLFNFHIYGDELINNEMMAGSTQTAKLLIVGLCIMLLFMGIALRDFSIRQIILLTFSSVGSPMLAMAATFAILGWMDVRFNSMMSISPFLVLGIGVDDAFLLVHSWRKHSKLSGNSIKIMELVVNEAGPSITITSVTNILAFSVGIFSPANQMSSFCLCTTIAVALDYILEFTLFSPCLALCSPQRKENNGKLIRHDKENKRWSKYASFLLTIWGRLICLFVVIFLIIFSFFGVNQMEADFDPQKTFPSDSHLQKSLRPINQLYVDYKPLSFIVHSPPDVGNSTQLNEFLQMVDRIETLPGGLKNSTQLWLRDYIDYDELKYLKQNTSEPYHLSYAKAPQFLSDHLMEDKHIVFYRREGPKVIIESFVFVVVFSGEKNWHQRAFFVEEIRNIIDEYPQFNTTVFDYDATIFDLIITVKSEMLKAILVTLACTTIVCFVFIPNFKYTGLATLSVLSISYNLLGALGFWGNELDPVTLINLLMSIGFSVDFTAHICYHHWHADRNDRLLGIEQTERTAHQRLVTSLSSVGRPMIEAALSTIICMFPLFLINIYVVVSFAKTVLCIGFLGLLHGLFILPVLLTIPSPFKCRHKKHSTGVQSNDSDSPLMAVLT